MSVIEEGGGGGKIDQNSCTNFKNLITEEEDMIKGRTIFLENQ